MAGVWRAREKGGTGENAPNCHIIIECVLSVRLTVKFQGTVVGQADTASALRELTVQLRSSEMRTEKDMHYGSSSWGHQPGWEVRKGFSE